MISRRKFVKDMALAGAAGSLGFSPSLLAAAPGPETKRIRLSSAALCSAPTIVAEELLRAEGFDDIQVPRQCQPNRARNGRGRRNRLWSLVRYLHPGQYRRRSATRHSLGAHAGCIEVFGAPGIRTLRDLKGKVVATPVRGQGPNALLALMFAYIGIDPNRDIEWRVEPRHEEAVRLLEEGKVHAYSASPPRSLEMRVRGIRNVILNTTTDRPWSEHFCCMVVANREFVRKNPVATKRAMRAILKGANLCANPEPTARHLVSRGFYKDHDITLQMLRDLPYARWRDYDTEDTVRYYALRLHEAGMIKSSPKKILAEATDFRFLNELKKELKT